jgi:glycerol-3-phosphate acyltransferase PlsY
MLETLALLIFAYLLGSISAAIVLSRVMGFDDPRSGGSKNPGATNVLRIAGKKAAFFTLVGDFLKGFVPVLLARLLETDVLVMALTGFAAFIGHCFPLFFAFRGGKGVATAIAATLAFDWVVGALLVATWLLIAKVFRISSLAAIVAFGLMPLAVFWRTQDPAVSLVFVTLSAILIWRHRSNIQRLIRGTES